MFVKYSLYLKLKSSLFFLSLTENRLDTFAVNGINYY
jgi:hypothetical protein